LVVSQLRVVTANKHRFWSPLFEGSKVVLKNLGWLWNSKPTSEICGKMNSENLFLSVKHDQHLFLTAKRILILYYYWRRESYWIFKIIIKFYISNKNCFYSRFQKSQINLRYLSFIFWVRLRKRAPKQR
jgi:hypothetical protein